MSCSNGGGHVQANGGRTSQVALRCCKKGNVLLSIHTKVSRKKGRWSTINLTTMIEATKV
jgi:hypothetical protein